MKKNQRIDYSTIFDKQLKKATLEIKIKFKERFILFLNNPFSSLLNNHSLTGRLKGHRSINITGDWCAIYSELNIKNQKVIIFEMLGTHSQLYK